MLKRDSYDAAQLLPQDHSYYALLWPYVTPYLVYVAISSIPESILAADAAEIVKLAATSAAMLFFWKSYAFGKLKFGHVSMAVAALPVALIAWILPFHLLEAVGVADGITTSFDRSFSDLYFLVKLINSVVLVAVFEELLMRVYIMGWFFQAGLQRNEKGLLGSIMETLDQTPSFNGILPLSTFSVVGATIIFAAGHQAHEYLSAICYFLFTTWLYKKAGSLWVCIVIHGLTNLAIALLARFGGMGWLW